MFNLIIGCLEGRVAADRVLEYTDSELKTWFESAGDLDVSRLAALPTLLMPETSDSRSEQLARIGHVENVTRAGRNWRFRFVDNPSIAPIDTARIENLATDLGIEEFEFRRTHWAVKNVDVYSWQGIAAPKGLPADVRDKFHGAVVAALNDPQVKQQLTGLGLEIVGNTPAQFTAFQQQEFARWKKVIEVRKITAD